MSGLAVQSEGLNGHSHIPTDLFDREMIEFDRDSLLPVVVDPSQLVSVNAREHVRSTVALTDRIAINMPVNTARDYIISLIELMSEVSQDSKILQAKLTEFLPHGGRDRNEFLAAMEVLMENGNELTFFTKNYESIFPELISFYLSFTVSDNLPAAQGDEEERGGEGGDENDGAEERKKAEDFIGDLMTQLSGVVELSHPRAIKDGLDILLKDTEMKVNFVSAMEVLSVDYDKLKTTLSQLPGAILEFAAYYVDLTKDPLVVMKERLTQEIKESETRHVVLVQIKPKYEFYKFENRADAMAYVKSTDMNERELIVKETIRGSIIKRVKERDKSGNETRCTRKGIRITFHTKKQSIEFRNINKAIAGLENLDDSYFTDKKIAVEGVKESTREGLLEEVNSFKGNPQLRIRFVNIHGDEQQMVMSKDQLARYIAPEQKSNRIMKLLKPLDDRDQKRLPELYVPSTIIEPVS